MFITELSKRKVLCLIFVVFLLYMLINGKCRLIIKDNTVIKVQDGIFQKREMFTCWAQERPAIIWPGLWMRYWGNTLQGGLPL